MIGFAALALFFSTLFPSKSGRIFWRFSIDVSLTLKNPRPENQRKDENHMDKTIIISNQKGSYESAINGESIVELLLTELHPPEFHPFNVNEVLCYRGYS